MKKSIPELETHQEDEVLNRVEELYAKFEKGLLKRLERKNKFMDHFLPTFKINIPEEVHEEKPHT